MSQTAYGQFEGFFDVKLKAQNVATTSRQFYSDGNVRNETKMNIPGMGVKEMVTIFKADDPDRILSLDVTNKTYSEIDLSSMPMMQNYSKNASSKRSDAKIEKLGKEKILGYTCQHIRISSEGNKTELWITDKILGYEAFEKMSRQNKNANQGFMSAMQKAGVRGFPLKMLDKSSGMVWEVVKIKKQKVPASKFAVPKGYSKVAMPGMGGMSEEQMRKMQEMMEKMKSR
jgi:hypothetical protein